MKTQTEEQVKLTREAVETELEFMVLTALINSLYAEPGFSDVGVIEIAEILSTRDGGVVQYKPSTVKGVLGSLCKKQICYVDEQFVDCIYLDRGYWFLHPEWCSEVECKWNGVIRGE
jgi:hypothetical protein